MESRFVKAVIVVVCAGLPAAAVYGGATLMQDNRSVEVYASVTEAGNTEDYGPVVDSAMLGKPFITAIETPELESSPNGRSRASASASQMSSLTGGSAFTSVTATGEANAMMFFSTSPLSAAQGDSSSDLLFRFSIATPQEWSISANIENGVFHASSFVRLRDVGSDEYLFDLSATGSGEYTDSDSGLLPPGEYEILSQALVRMGSPSKWTSSYSQFDFDFIVVPEPAAGLLALCCAGVMMRRKRR